MKLTTLTLAGLMTVLTAIPSQADDLMAGKKGVTFAGATAAGIALGGPAGMIVGALTGAWFAEQMEDAAQLGEKETELRLTVEELGTTRSELDGARSELALAHQANEHYASLVMEQLQLEMLFRTGAAELTDSGRQRLTRLAGFLIDNPLIAVQLDGYADPRGGEGYNLDLSRQRVAHVASLLRESGVEEARIRSYSHGDGSSRSAQGDYDAYALERVVKIQLSPAPAEGLARSH